MIILQYVFIRKWNLYDLAPRHQYRVYQKPRGGWTNTQPGSSVNDERGWPCYTFPLQPAQAAELWFGYVPTGTPVTAGTEAAASGIRILDNILDTAPDCTYKQENFVDVDTMTPEQRNEEEFHLFLPRVSGR